MILNHTLAWRWDKQGIWKGGGIDFCGFTVRRKSLEFGLGWLQDLLLADPHGHPPLCLWEEKRLFPNLWDVFHTFRSKNFQTSVGKGRRKCTRGGTGNGGTIHAVLGVGASGHLKAACSVDWEHPGLGTRMLPSSAAPGRCAGPAASREISC